MRLCKHSKKLKNKKSAQTSYNLIAFYILSFFIKFVKIGGIKKIMQRIKQKIKHIFERVLFWLIVYTIEIILITPMLYMFYKMIEYKLLNY